MNRLPDIRQEMKTSRYVIPGILLFIGIAYAIIYWFMPYSGDDLENLIIFTGWCEGNGPHDLSYYPYYGIARHWKWINGRISDMLNPFMPLMIPHRVNAILNSVSITAMLAFAMKLCRFPNQAVTGKIVLISIIIFAFPWWDSFQVFDVVYNYVFSSALCLWFLTHFLNRSDQYTPKNRFIQLLWCLLFFIAGGMHEACGVPISCGLIAYFVMSKGFASLSRYKKYITWSFFAGTLFCFASRGIWDRLNRMQEPNDPIGWLILKSDTIVLILLVAVLIALCFKSSRHRLIKLSHTEWIIFFIAAIASLCFSAVSGIVGRSGWFANLFALIAIFRWVNSYKFSISQFTAIGVSTILSVTLIAHFIEFARYQVILGKEHDEMLALFNASPDGTIYMDATFETDIPWWILNKTRGVPDADDIHLIYWINYYHGRGGKTLAILPKSVKDIDWKRFRGLQRLSNGDYITDTPPFDPQTPHVLNHIFKMGKHEWVGVPFKINDNTYYLITPRLLDPGDR